MKIWFGFVFLMIFLTLSANADGLKPSDFAKGVVLDVENGASIYKFTLPEFVYEGLIRPDLGDMRIFNNAGEVVPFVVEHNNEKLSKKMHPSVPLPIFPVYGGRTEKGNHPTPLHLKIDSRGTLFLFGDSHMDGDDSGERVAISYIIDASMLESSPDRLALHWDYGKKDLVAEISIYGSNDLADWSPVLKTGAIADIVFGQYVLKQTEINIPSFDFKYLKLTWPEKLAAVKLTGVNALFPDSYSYEEQPRHWTQVLPLKPDTESYKYFFSTKYYLPVDRVRIAFPHKNTLVNAELKSRKKADDPWENRFGGLLYNLTVEGMKLKNTEIHVRVGDAFQWFFKVDPSGGGIGSGLPYIELGWQPHTVMFVARGEGPFVLAYGNGAIEAPPARMESLISDLDWEKEKYLVRDALLTASIELGGPKQLEKPRPPIQWAKIILWLILIGGVAAAGKMAWSLYRQMNLENN